MMLFDLGEEIRIVNSPYEVRGDTIGTFSLLNWYHSISIDTVAGIGGRLPLDGETFTILANSELTENDTFSVTITPPKINEDPEIVKNQIDEVRVVPNPYIVNASWEQMGEQP